MKFNSDIHHRRSIRLKNYDYSQAGAYFVTVCAQSRECLFGEIADGVMVMNDAGEMIEQWWMKLPDNFSTVENDAYVVMPNHFHGIIVLAGAGPRACPDSGRTHGCAPTLGDVMIWFKTMTTNQYIRGVKESHWPLFPGKLWQRNYYEHIIRNEEELNKIREYIINNPVRWVEDEENPACRSKEAFA